MNKVQSSIKAYEAIYGLNAKSSGNENKNKDAKSQKKEEFREILNKKLKAA